jgi:hypothetical protein
MDCNHPFAGNRRTYDYSAKRLQEMGQQSANILDCDLIIAPANIRRSHWTCAVADLRNKRFIYLDSSGVITLLHPLPPLLSSLAPSSQSGSLLTFW